jgi:hypothetical protein
MTGRDVIIGARAANGSYVTKRYTILTATGGVSGSFASLRNTNLQIKSALGCSIG